MRVFIRADASRAIGTGHVMRCLTVADALAEGGARVHFVCRAHDAHLGDLIGTRGHAVTLLPQSGNGGPQDLDTPDRGPYAGWLGCDQATDARQTLEAIAAAGPADVLLVDHYALDRTFERMMRPHVGRIAVIDDLADRPHDCDVLIDQTFGRSGTDYEGLVPARTRLLLGLRYALVAPAFVEARRRRDGTIGRIIVFMGGVDANNAGRDVIEGLEAAGAASRGLQVDLLVGGANPHRDTLVAWSVGRPWLRLIEPRASLAPILGEYDLAVGAGGVAAVERVIAGLPSITVTVATNQETGATALAEAGALLHIGSHGEATSAAVADAVRFLLRVPSTVRHVASRATDLCDGWGLRRVARCLLADSVRLRRATTADAELVWRWRNHPSTRAQSGDPTEIPLDRHLVWFERAVESVDRALLLATEGAEPCGVLRFDFDGDRAVVSIFVDPTRHGGGLGSRMLDAGISRILREWPSLKGLDARVLHSNEASRRLFVEAGFVERESLFSLDFTTPSTPTIEGTDRSQETFH